MKQQIHQLAAAAAAAASAYPAALAQLAAASSGAFSQDFAAASALAAVSLPMRSGKSPLHVSPCCSCKQIMRLLRVQPTVVRAVPSVGNAVKNLLLMRGLGTKL